MPLIQYIVPETSENRDHRFCEDDIYNYLKDDGNYYRIVFSDGLIVVSNKDFWRIVEGPSQNAQFTCERCSKNVFSNQREFQRWHKIESESEAESKVYWSCKKCYCSDCDATIESDDCDCIVCKCGAKADCSTCDGCADCCSCFVCGSCDRRFNSNNESPCGNCNSCSNCCECRYCDSCCETRSSDRFNCSNCDFCEDCCNCESHSGIEVCGSNKDPHFHLPKTKNGNLDPIADKKRRFLAVEIEVASSETNQAYHVNKALDSWQAIAVPDGSLPESGYEINTAPAKGEAFERQIREICGALKKARAEVDTHCGLHVHIDCRDLRYYDLRKVIYTYSKVEESLFSMIAPSRTSNHYCRKLRSKIIDPLSRHYQHDSNKGWRNDLLSVYYDRQNIERGGFRQGKYNDARYYALNLHSWFYRGTIEFRHHHGTVNADKIINWAKICESVINYAMNHSEKDLLNDPEFNGLPMHTILSRDLYNYYVERKEHFEGYENE